MSVFRFAVIGAGIAGASVAYELAAEGRVIVLERETVPGYHTTGRSAAIYSETYGNATIRALSTASRPFLENPPPGFCEYPLLTRSGSLIIGGEQDLPELDRQAREFRKLVPSVRRLDGVEARAIVPILKPDYVAGAVFEPNSMHMDVHAIHHGYLRGLAARGGQLMVNAAASAIRRQGDLWRIDTPQGAFMAETLVNAAGSWVDDVAALAGVSPIGIQPKRRTAAIVAAPPGLDAHACPFVISVAQSFYFCAEAGKILISLSDETPSPPCDAYPEDYDVALAIDRIQEAAEFPVTRVERSWAGLRNFVADRSPVAGYDAGTPGFFWLAGQGGYGIQTAPAMAEAAAALASGKSLPSYIGDLGVTAGMLSPRRLKQG